jgi:hypothetical protein
MTLGFDYKTRQNETMLRIRGDSDFQINGDFEVIDVPNRFYVKFKTTLPDNTYTINGAQVLNYAYNVLDGRHTITSVPTLVTFAYNISDVQNYQTVEPSVLHTNIRITGAADIERAEAAYTNWEGEGYIEDKFYIFVTAGNSVASKDRNILNDATQVIGLGNDFRQKIIEDFDVNVFCPVSTDTLCFETRDILEDIKLALIGTLYGVPQIQQYVAQNNYIYTFVNDFDIVLNRSRLIHGYKFETVYNIGWCDAYKFGNLTPFRNINFNTVYENKNNTQYINLDVDPEFS